MERGLIIKKKWLDLIFDNGKVWEMRSRPTNIRGRIGLIQSGSGMIVGECTIVNCWNFIAEQSRADWFDWNDYKSCHMVDDVSMLEKWRYPWVLHNAKRYETPTPYKHPQGAVIWVKLSANTPLA